MWNTTWTWVSTIPNVWTTVTNESLPVRCLRPDESNGLSLLVQRWWQAWKQQEQMLEVEQLVYLQNENKQNIVGQSKSGMRMSGCGETFQYSSDRAWLKGPIF